MSGLGHLSPWSIAALSAFGWVSGLCAQYVLRRDVWGHLICSCFALLCWELWAVVSRLATHTAPLDVLLRVALPELAWSLAFTLPVYWLARFCCVNYGRIYHE